MTQKGHPEVSFSIAGLSGLFAHHGFDQSAQYLVVRFFALFVGGCKVGALAYADEVAEGEHHVRHTVVVDVRKVGGHVVVDEVEHLGGRVVAAVFYFQRGYGHTNLLPLASPSYL